MNSFFPFLDIIILGLLALFLGFRLKNLLGDRSGYGEDINNSETYNEKKPDNNNVINLNKKKISGEGLETLKKADPKFSEEEFLNDAKQAFEIIIEAFVDSDIEKLKPLIDYELLKSFTKSISEREARQEKQFVEIISVQKIDIINISINENIASISLKIESDQIKYTVDKNDVIVDGDKEVSEIIKDKWILERDISSNNPNWKLVETDVANDWQGCLVARWGRKQIRSSIMGFS